MNLSSSIKNCRPFLRGTMGGEGVVAGATHGAETGTPNQRAGGKQSILLIENDPVLGAQVAAGLKLNGFDVTWVRSGAEGYALLFHKTPAALILDWMLPQLDGVTLLHRVRQSGIVCPVLFLVAAQEVPKRISTLSAGADSYLAKPFGLPELIVRLRTLMQAGPDAENSTHAKVHINAKQRLFRRQGALLQLTPCETAILEFLARHPGEVVPRAALIEVLDTHHPARHEATNSLQDRSDALSHHIDPYITSLQRKLEAGGRPRVLHVVREVGVLLEG